MKVSLNLFFLFRKHHVSSFLLKDRGFWFTAVERACLFSDTAYAVKCLTNCSNKSAGALVIQLGARYHSLGRLRERFESKLEQIRLISL